ncbi:MAG: fimbrillin family protein [Rikenellaceae bacterium]
MDNQEVSFSTYTGISTKGLVTDTDGTSTTTGIQTTGIGVYGFFQDEESWSNTSYNFTPNFMYNQQVTYAASAWSYTPVKYWSNDTADKYSFFAYAPYSGYTDSGITTNSANTASGAPSIKYTINSDATKMVDFVAGQVVDIFRGGQTAQANVTTATNKVDFYLKHQLSRVKFTGKTNITTTDNATANTVVVVKNMYITGNTASAVSSSLTSSEFYTDAVYTFDDTTTTSTNTDHTQDGTWSSPTAATTDYNFTGLVSSATAAELTINSIATSYNTTSTAVITNDATEDAIFTDGQYLFLIPPTSTGLSGDDKMYIYITYDIVTADSELDGKYTVSSNAVTIALPSTTLHPGVAYNMILTFSLYEVTLSATVVDWDTTTANESTGTTTGTSTDGTTVDTTGIPVTTT